MPDRWRIHTVALDLDDTLYPEREYVLSGFAAVDTWLRDEHGFDGFNRHAQQLFDAGHRGRIFDEALSELGRTTTPELVTEMVAVYRAHTPTLELHRDAERFLTWCAEVKLRLAIVTDGYAGVQRSKLKALGMDSRIACCLVTDELGGRSFWKPHPEAFQRVMTTHPGPPSGYVYVGDNARKDFIAPRALGWRTVRVRRAGSEHAAYDATPDQAADADIVSLMEIVQLVEPAA